jgi:hypothetical protein
VVSAARLRMGDERDRASGEDAGENRIAHEVVDRCCAGAMRVSNEIRAPESESGKQR